MTDRDRMPRGRTEVPVEDGKYTVVIDYRPGMEGLAILRNGEPWITVTDDEKVVIAMTCELERCRDLLYAIKDAAEDDNVLDHSLHERIRKVLPRDYRPAKY